MARRKKFFREPTVAEIMKHRVGREIVPKEIKNALEGITENEYNLIVGEILPNDIVFRDSYGRKVRVTSHKKFEKHAPVITPKALTQNEAMERKRFPYQEKRELIRNAKDDGFYVGFGFRPNTLDKRLRRTLFTSTFDAAAIYAYGYQSGEPIEVVPYVNAKRVRIEGGELVFKVPSRTEKHPRYEFKLMAFPISDSIEKYYIDYNLGTTHSCKDIQYRIRYKFVSDLESSQVVNLCGHVGAGVLAGIDYLYSREKNKVPLNCGQFDIPTQRALDLYKNLVGRTLIRENKDKKPRKLDRAERNFVLGQILQEIGYDEMYFPNKNLKGQGFISDYDWRF